MDLLVQLAELKGKSIAYCFNNTKIRKIVSIQRHKESTNATVDKIKQKLKRWRMFTRTTMDDPKNKPDQGINEPLLDKSLNESVFLSKSFLE